MTSPVTRRAVHAVINVARVLLLRMTKLHACDIVTEELVQTLPVTTSHKIPSFTEMTLFFPPPFYLFLFF